MKLKIRQKKILNIKAAQNTHHFGDGIRANCITIEPEVQSMEKQIIPVEIKSSRIPPTTLKSPENGALEW